MLLKGVFVRFFPTGSRVLAAIAIVALAACAGRGAIPPSGPTAAAASVERPAGTAPCDTLAGTWDFQGSCVAVGLKKGGGAFTLPLYDHILIQAAYFKNNGS